MMEPAPIEHLSTLRAKSGSDVDKEIYAFKDKGGRDVGLRFDLTVGMTRYVCSRRDLKPPVKLASIAGAWRYDEPQHARYRWFRQWDLEIFGPPSVESDAEVIEATYRLFERLGLKFEVHIGDRAAVQGFVNDVLGVKEEAQAVDLLRALDKAQKRSLADLKSEYGKKGFKDSTLESLFDFGRISGSPESVLKELSSRKADASSLELLRDALKDRGLTNVKLDMGVVRGIDYYTGVVFEVIDPGHPDLGSLAGGGRYDLLPRSFGRPDLSATGAAGGMERIAMALMGSSGPIPPLVYVASAGEGARAASFGVLSRLRSAGIAAEASLIPRPLSKQLEDASRMGASWALLVGAREPSAAEVTLRDMKTRKEDLLSLEDALSRLQKESSMG